MYLLELDVTSPDYLFKQESKDCTNNMVAVVFQSDPQKGSTLNHFRGGGDTVRKGPSTI